MQAAAEIAPECSSPDRVCVQAAERDYDLNRAAELKYGTLLQLQRQLKEAEEKLRGEGAAPCAAQLLSLAAFVGARARSSGTVLLCCDDTMTLVYWLQACG